MSFEVETSTKKIAELKPFDKHVNVLFKVVEVGEPRSVTNRNSGETHEVADVVVGDETASIILTAWNDTIDDLEEGQTYQLNNGYVTLFRGHMRLSVGKFGQIEPSDDEITEVNSEVNRSDEEFEQPRRRDSFRGNRGFGGGGRRFGDRRGGRPRYGDEKKYW